MRPFDLGLVRDEPAVRRPLATLGVLGVVQGALAIAQAIVVARLVVTVVAGTDLLGPAVGVLVVFGLRAITSGIAERVAGWAGAYVASRLRARAVQGWLARSVDTRPHETVMLTRATEGAEAIEPYVARYLPALIGATVVPVLAVIALACTDWVSALAVVLTLPLLPLFAALIGLHTRAETAARWRETDRLTGHFLDVMRGLPTLVNYQRAEHQVHIVRTVGDRLRRATVRTLRTAFLSSAALELLATISVAIVAVAVGLRLVQGELDLQVGLVAILLAPEAYWPIRRVGQEFHAAADGAQAIAELRANAGHQPRTAAGRGSRVRAAALDYRYPGTERLVLRNFSCDTGIGLTALVGESGAGKTTVLELLAGVRTPAAGHVERPGHVHYVTQRPFLVPGTVSDNLTLGGRLPDGDGWLPEPLRRLPDGLETRVGDDGFGLSAGQRALLALTRARLSDAAVILLDEPTAHLDVDMRQVAESMIRELAADRVVIVATHSESLISLADNVVRLRAGQAADSGDRPTESGGRASRGREWFRQAQPSREQAQPSSEQAGRSQGVANSVWRPAPGVLRAAFVGALAATCGVALTATSGWLIVQASTRPPVLSLLVAIVCVRAFGIGRPVLRYVERICSHDAALADLVDRRAALFSRLIPLTPARLGRRRRADVLTAAVADLDDEVNLQVRTLVPLVGTAIAAAITVAVVSALHPASGAVLIGMLLVVAAAAWWDFRLELGAQRETLRARAAVNDRTQLLVTNLSAVQAISAGEELTRSLARAAADSVRAVGRQARGRGIGLALTTLTTGVGLVLTALVAHAALGVGAVSAPVAALLVLGPLALADLFGGLPDAMGAAARGEGARRRLAALTASPPAVYDEEPLTAYTQARPALRLHDVQASCTGRHVDLAVDDFRLAPGERVSVTGPNGVGKSTLLAVLARHLETTSGTYEFGSVNVRDLPLDAVRSRIAIVDDEPHVFAGSVRANLLLARPSADDAEIGRALVDAGLGGWLARLPQGLDTELGAGRSVSGGERTRLAIARAVLSGRAVLLLDEPVAHLDSATARAVLADLRGATAGATVVAVSHQAVTELRPDRTVVLARPVTSEQPAGGGDRVQERAGSAQEDTVASW